MEDRNLAAIQIQNHKYIHGMQLMMQTVEEDGFSVLYGVDDEGVKYMLDKIKLEPDSPI